MRTVQPLSISFDYNIPAAWTLTKFPDRMINVEATSLAVKGELGLVTLKFNIVDTMLADLYRPVDIYQDCLDKATEKLEAMLREGDPQHISEVMASMTEIHAPLSVDTKGELKSCVELSEDDVLRKKLMTVSDNSVIGMAIRMGAEKNLEATKKMIKDQINDNAEMMTELLGSDLMQEFSYGK
jgi:glycerol-3-phosphate O-acyltransferase